MKLSGVFKTIGGFISNHERILLTGVTIGSELLAVAEALKEGPTFEKIKEEVKERKENGEEVTKKEIAGKCAVPVLKIIIPLVISIISAILNHKKSSEAIQSLTSLVILGREGKAAYVASVKANTDPETAEKIEEEAIKDQANRQLRSGNRLLNKIYRTGHGDALFYDSYTGAWFESDANFLESCVNELNRKILDGLEYQENVTVLLGDLYDMWDVPRTGKTDNSCWNHDTGLIRIGIKPEKNEANQFYGCITYKNEPTTIRW